MDSEWLKQSSAFPLQQVKAAPVSVLAFLYKVLFSQLPCNVFLKQKHFPVWDFDDETNMVKSFRKRKLYSGSCASQMFGVIWENHLR